MTLMHPIDQATELNDPLVLITYQPEPDYEIVVDKENECGGSVHAVVEYLSQWDYGEEKDAEASVNGYTDLSEIHSWSHQVHEDDCRGTHYWLVLDHGLCFYALYRRPIDG